MFLLLTQECLDSKYGHFFRYIFVQTCVVSRLEVLCRSKAGITLDEEDVPHLLEALQANNGQRESMMLQLAESDEFTLLGSFKFSSDARNASLNAADVDAELEDMLRVTLPNDDPSMYMDDIDAMRYGADAEVTDLPSSAPSSVAHKVLGVPFILKQASLECLPF